jgi:hypothetical protein
MLNLLPMALHKGHNSDITVKGISYHVQTEDWGDANPFLVSRVFKNGAVIKTIKTSHAEVLEQGSIRPTEAIQTALKRQHNSILDQVFAGKI